MKHPGVFFICFAFIFFPSFIASAQMDWEYRSLAECVKIMENSDITYRIRPADTDSVVTIAPRLYPCMKDLPESFIVEDVGDGNLRIKPLEIPEEDLVLIQKGEMHFRRKQYEKAREFYQKVVENTPQNYHAYSYIGDCYLFTGDPERAIQFYDTAISINPYGYQAHYYRGNALANVGRFDEALDEYIETLALNPRHQFTLLSLHKYSDQMNIDIVDSLVTPYCYIGFDGDTIDLFVAEDHMAWVNYAIPKAVQIGEGTKETPDGKRTLHWSLMSEAECLVSLVSGYETLRVEGTFKEDDESINRIAPILASEDAVYMIIYEIGSRIAPDMPITMGRKFHQGMKKYIRKYMVIQRS